MAGSFMNIGPSDLGFIEREQRVQDAAALRRWEAERDAERYEDQRADIEFQQQMAADMARQQMAIRGSSEARAERESEFSADMARQQAERQREVEDRSFDLQERGFGLQERGFAEDVANRKFVQDLQMREEQRAEAAFNISNAVAEIGIDTAELENESRRLAVKMQELELEVAEGKISKEEADAKRKALQGSADNQARALAQTLNEVRREMVQRPGMPGVEKLDKFLAELEDAMQNGGAAELQEKTAMGWEMIRESEGIAAANKVMQRRSDAYTNEEKLAIEEQQMRRIAEVKREYADSDLPFEITKGLLPKLMVSHHVAQSFKDDILEGGEKGRKSLITAAKEYTRGVSNDSRATAEDLETAEKLSLSLQRAQLAKARKEDD